MLEILRRVREDSSAMDLSVVVVVHDMPHAARNMLRSLASDHQREIEAADYEVIVVDNGSVPPLDTGWIEGLRGSFRCVRIDDASPSPGPAVNRGVREAGGRIVGVIPDGARIATPRLLATARRAVESHRRAVVTTVGWQLGRIPADVPVVADDDANAAETARLLAKVGWPDEPYRLFEVSRLDGSQHWFGPGMESTATFLRREVWDEVGGMNERFEEPGGGFVCLDLYARLLALPAIEPMMLLGEGTFHQPHGGVSTDVPPADLRPRVDAWIARYREIAGHDLPLSTPELTYFGRMPESWRVQLVAWALRETLEQVPSLARARARLDARVMQTPAAERSVWQDLHAIRDLLVEAGAALAAAEADAAAARADAERLRVALGSMAPRPLTAFLRQAQRLFAGAGSRSRPRDTD